MAGLWSTSKLPIAAFGQARLGVLREPRQKYKDQAREMLAWTGWPEEIVRRTPIVRAIAWALEDMDKTGETFWAKQAKWYTGRPKC